MSQNQAIIMCVIVVILSIIAIIFFKNKYAKQAGTVKPVGTTPEITNQEFANKEKLHLDKIAELESALARNSGVPAGYVAQAEIDGLVAKSQLEKAEATKAAAALSQTIADITNEKNSAQKQVSSLQGTVDNLSGEKDVLVKKVAEMEAARQAHQSVDAEGATKLAQLEDVVSQLQDAVSQAKQEKSVLESALDNSKLVESEVSELRNTVASLNQEKDSLEKSLDSYKAFEARASELEGFVTLLNHEKQELQGIVASQAKTIEEKSVVPVITQVVEESIVKSILVVDDSLVVRNKMKKLLENNGYDIVTANDGLEALEKLPSKEFSLVITDLEMPNLDGFGLIKKIGEDIAMKDIPIMAITGHEEIKVQVSQSESLYSVHKKPWKDEDILKKIEGLTRVK